MVRIILLCSLLLVSCTPRYVDHLSGQQFSELERQVAVEQWKESQGKTDGCSTPLIVDRIGAAIVGKNWDDCCFMHDFDYRYGWLYGISKEQADYSLWECVNSSGSPLAARVVYTGVLVGGGFYYNDGE